MNPSFQLIIAGVAVIVFAVIGILLLTPAEKRRGRFKASDQSKTEEPVKDWQAVSLKLERHIQALRREVENFQKNERALQRDLEVQKEKYAKLQDKLAQERDWQKREEEDSDRKAKEIAALKSGLSRAEEELNKFHLEKLKIERESRELKTELDGLIQAKRGIELQAQKLEAENDVLKKDVKELKWENAKLSEKKDAESWVPKEDYEKLQNEVRAKDQELSRLRERIKKEML